MLADVVRVPVPEALEPRSIQRVLLAFDGSAGAWHALERAIEVAVGQHALLTIAGVVGEPTVWTGFGPARCRSRARCCATTSNGRWSSTWRWRATRCPPPCRSTRACSTGARPPCSPRSRTSGNYDLVVAGPRPAGRLRRVFGRSVTHALLTRSAASVLAVKA